MLAEIKVAADPFDPTRKKIYIKVKDLEFAISDDSTSTMYLMKTIEKMQIEDDIERGKRILRG